MPTRAGLLLSPARGIHTLGMRFAVDVVFLSPQMRVLGLAPRVQPWRIVLAPRGAGRVLDTPADRYVHPGRVERLAVRARANPRLAEVAAGRGRSHILVCMRRLHARDGASCGQPSDYPKLH